MSNSWQFVFFTSRLDKNNNHTLKVQNTFFYIIFTRWIITQNPREPNENCIKREFGRPILSLCPSTVQGGRLALKPSPKLSLFSVPTLGLASE